MASHHCEFLVITCIDFRFQEYINKWISENLPPNSYDKAAFAGCVKNFDIILDQTRISKRLHNIKEVILINHEDCGAYGQENIPDQDAEHQIHNQDLKKATAAVKSEFPGLAVRTFYLHLNGEFEKIV